MNPFLLTLFSNFVIYKNNYKGKQYEAKNNSTINNFMFCIDSM